MRFGSELPVVSIRYEPDKQFLLLAAEAPEPQQIRIFRVTAVRGYVYMLRA